MKKKYISPSLEIVDLFLGYALLASISNPGGGESGQGTDPSQGVGGGGGSPYPGGSEAKDHRFNAWENWDEY